MPDVESIEPGDGDARLTHWRVSGPLGKTVEWDARIVEDVPGSKIAWASTEGTVRTSGAVRFDDHGSTTGVEVSLDYDPPGGAAAQTRTWRCLLYTSPSPRDS